MPIPCYLRFMSRPLRIEYPGAVYHVTSRGNEKKAVFKDDQDRENFIRTLQHVNKRYNWLCHAYCLMDNHYHLLIETPDGNLARDWQRSGIALHHDKPDSKSEITHD